ncbi:MAG: uncharacterized protein A8A55_1590 [Amphiamblys sp. WSBS2006]|nr:MAG: uncharacterized protein A8A55_1590 [Amphiamblys sp. WSBS2006]
MFQHTPIAESVNTSTLKQRMGERFEPVLVYSILQYLEGIGLADTVDALHREVGIAVTREERTTWIGCINGAIPVPALVPLWASGQSRSPPTPTKDEPVNRTKSGMLKALNVLFPGRTPESLDDGEKKMVVSYFREHVDRRGVGQERRRVEQSGARQRHGECGVSGGDADKKKRVYYQQQNRISRQISSDGSQAEAMFSPCRTYPRDEDMASMHEEKLQKQKVHMLNKAITIAEKEGDHPEKRREEGRPLEEAPKKEPLSDTWASPLVELDFSDLLQNSGFEMEDII